jgi:hypothetical protein
LAVKVFIGKKQRVDLFIWVTSWAKPLGGENYTDFTLIANGKSIGFFLGEK